MSHVSVSCFPLIKLTVSGELYIDMLRILHVDKLHLLQMTYVALEEGDIIPLQCLTKCKCKVVQRLSKLQAIWYTGSICICMQDKAAQFFTDFLYLANTLKT